MNNECVQCGQTREAIKLHKLLCCTVSNTEAGMETDYEWNRHRFKPYSEKEFAGQRSDEEEMLKQMGEMADFVKSEENKTNK